MTHPYDAIPELAGVATYASAARIGYSVDDNVRRLLPPTIRWISSATEDTLDPHLIIQFHAGTRVVAGDIDITSPAPNRLIVANDLPNREMRLSEELGLISFFTAGDKETRAWTLRRGQSALEAAATIHTDIARGFIRCEVIRWNDLVEAGSHAEAARAGLQRLEGKTYEVEDGDVLNVRFNV